MDNAIETSALTKDYGRGRGIFDLDLQVHRGEAFGFIGPNGAGKTTTIRLLLDLVRPDRGHASMLGMDTQRDGVAIRRRTAYVPGESPDYPNQRGMQILDLLAHLRGGVDPARISALAKRFDLDVHRKYREYSHGNKQKVWLVAAFMADADLYILDEPTTGLDPLMQQQFKDLIQEAKQRGATIFLSSHVLSEVQEICDRIGVVHEGHLRQIGTLNELRISHVRRVEAHLRNSVDVQRLHSLPGVADVQVGDHTVQCTVTGDMEPLLAVLQSAHLESLDSNELSLEEVFLAQYGQPART